MKQTENKHIHLWCRMSVLLLCAVCVLLLFSGSKAYADHSQERLEHNNDYFEAYSAILQSQLNIVYVDVSSFVSGTITGASWKSSDESVAYVMGKSSDGTIANVKLLKPGKAEFTVTCWIKGSIIPEIKKIAFLVHGAEKTYSTSPIEMHAIVKNNVTGSNHPVTTSSSYAYHGFKGVQYSAGEHVVVAGYVANNYTGKAWYRIVGANNRYAYGSWVSASNLEIIPAMKSVEVAYPDYYPTVGMMMKVEYAPYTADHKYADSAVTKVAWRSSNNSVATVNSKGEVTAVSSGNATIFVDVTGYSYSEKSVKTLTASCVFHVVSTETPPKTVSMNKSSLTLNKGNTSILSATVGPADATDKSVTWSSSDTSVATVDANGKVTAKGTGSCTITATANSNKNAKGSCAVTVKTATTTNSTTTVATFNWTSGTVGSATVNSTVTSITETSAKFPYYCVVNDTGITQNITEVGVVYTNLRTGVKSAKTEKPSFTGGFTYFYNKDGYSIYDLEAGMQYSYYYYAVYKGVTYTSAVKTFWTAGDRTAILKVECMVGGFLKPSFEGIGTFDFYVNGVQVGDDITSYEQTLNVGDTFEILDIRATGLNRFLYQNNTSSDFDHYYSTSGRVESGGTYVEVYFADNPSHTITLDPNGGVLPSENQVKVTVGSDAGHELANYAPTMENYAFDGWYTAEGVKVYDAESNCVNEGTYWASDLWCGSENVTLYAQWVDPEAPVIGMINVENTDITSFTVSCRITDNIGVEKVEFTVWNEVSSDENVVTLSGTQDGDSWSLAVDAADFDNAVDCGYYVSIYAYDAQGNVDSVDLEPVYLRVNVSESTADAFILPEGLVTVDSEAFAGVAARIVVIPAGVTSVAPDAFNDCPNLEYIVNYSAANIPAPEGVTVITD